MASPPFSVPAAPPATAAPSPGSSAAEQEHAPATPGVAIPTERKSEVWPYPLKLPSFPLDFGLLRNPKLSIFHDYCGHPLVRYYWPASTAEHAPHPSKVEQAPTRSIPARAIVVLVHDQGTHTVFDWLKNAPLMCNKNKEIPAGASQDPPGIISRLSSTDRNFTPEHLASPTPVDVGLICSEISACGRTDVGETSGTGSLGAAEAEKSSTAANTRERDDKAHLKGAEEDSVAAAAAGEAAAATVTAAAAETEGIATLLPAEPLFHDFPQNPLHAVRTACYEGSWVELFNASGFDVYAVDLLQHGLSALVERQQQRHRRRLERHQKKSGEAAADEGETKAEDDKEETPFSFDLVAEDLCCMLEDVSRFSTLPIFLLGQGTGATVATRAAELLAKKGKLGKPHLPRHPTGTATHRTGDLTATEESCADPITLSSEEVSSSPLLTGVRHIGKKTVLPVEHVAVQSRPIPLAGLVLLSPVLQLRESVALEHLITTATTAAAAKREKRRQLKHHEQQSKEECGLADKRRLSAESYTSELEHSRSAEEDEGETGTGSHIITKGKEKKRSSWNALFWLLGRSSEDDNAASTLDQCGVRLRRRRHPHTHHYVLLPPLDVEGGQKLEEEKAFDALYEKLYFRDRLTIKTLLPCRQLQELRKGLCDTLTDARWLLIPIERDSRQLVTAAAWQEQYRKWKKTIARRVMDRGLRAGTSDEQLLHQQSVLSTSSKENVFEVDNVSVDLTPWLEPETPVVGAAQEAPAAPDGIDTTGAASTQQTGTTKTQKLKQQEQEVEEIQHEPDATEAETRRRIQLKRMQMAFYLKVLVVQGMTAPHEIVNECCGSHTTIKAFSADQEVDCFAEAADVQGVVSFYRSLGGKANLARRILVQHGQLAPPQRKKASSRGVWLSQCCSSVGDDDVAAAALATAAAAEAAQTDSLVLLDVGSEAQRIGGDLDLEDEEATGEGEAEEEDEEDSEESGGEYAHKRPAGAADEKLDSTRREATSRGLASTSAAGTPYSSARTQGGPSPPWMLPPARTGDLIFPKIGTEGAAAEAAARAEEWKSSDLPDNADLEARYYALQEERKRLDQQLKPLDVEGLSREAEARAEEEEASARKVPFPSTLRRDSSVYKSVYERDLQRYGTVVRLPDRPVMLGQTNLTAADLCKDLLSRQCDCTFGAAPVLLSESAVLVGEHDSTADNEGVEGPRLEYLKWVKEYPATWQNFKGGMLLPHVCMQATCEGTTKVRVVETIKAPVQVVEKIFMHEATEALKATIAEIKAREQQLKGGKTEATEEAFGEELNRLDKEHASAEPTGGATAARAATRIPKKLRLRDIRLWRRVGAIIVDGKGKQVPLEQVEKLRVKFPREYVNLFLYGATCEAAAALAGAMASTDAMQRRQVTMWLLPEVHHAALCQGDEENKIGKQILHKWLLPALEDLQRSETLWQGSQVRSQLRRQLSNPAGQSLRSV